MKRREGGKPGAGGDAGRSPRTPDPAVTPGRGCGRPCGFVRAEASVSPAASSRTRGHDAAAEPEEGRRPRGRGRPPGVQRGPAAGARGGLAELRGGGARVGPHSPAGGRRVPPPPAAAARDGSRCPAGHPPEPPLGVAEAPRVPSAPTSSRVVRRVTSPLGLWKPTLSQPRGPLPAGPAPTRGACAPASLESGALPGAEPASALLRHGDRLGRVPQGRFTWQR